MAYPFSIARALHRDFLHHKQFFVTGYLDNSRKFLATDDEKFLCIDADTVSFNTGFDDINGTEIFIGDFLSLPQSDVKMEVVFDVDQGAFFCVQGPFEETETYEDKIVINRKTMMYRLTRKWASKMAIVGSIFDHLLQSEESS